MTSFRQIEANRNNAIRSTGPRTEAGKRQSRRNAIRYGLCAETVVEIIEAGTLQAVQLEVDRQHFPSGLKNDVGISVDVDESGLREDFQEPLDPTGVRWRL